MYSSWFDLFRVILYCVFICHSTKFQIHHCSSKKFIYCNTWDLWGCSNLIRECFWSILHFDIIYSDNVLLFYYLETKQTFRRSSKLDTTNEKVMLSHYIHVLVLYILNRSRCFNNDIYIQWYKIAEKYSFWYVCRLILVFSC